MKPNATIATGLIFALVAGPVGAQTQTQAPPAQTQQTAAAAQAPPAEPPVISAESLQRIREQLNREQTLRIENGQLRIYVEVIGHWPSFTDYAKGYDWINGPTGKGNPMSHAEFVAMSTPRDFYGNAGIGPAEVLSMAAVNLIGQWAITKAINKWSSSRKDKELKEIRAMIDAELAALAAAKKDK